MMGEEQYLERTSDLVAKVRKLREAAEKEMNKFSRVSDYDVRRVVGQSQKTPSEEPLPFPQEHGNSGEGA